MLSSKMSCASMRKSLEWLFIFIIVIIPSTKISATNFSLDSSIRDSAFTALHHHHTGIVYTVPIPTTFPDVEAAVIRMRTRSLWLTGANITTGVWISPGILPEPFVRRVVIVYQNLANWSSSYYKVNGYSLASPVLGILMYNASNGDEIVETNQKLSKEEKEIIHVTFPDPKSPMEMNSSAKCVIFRRRGGVEIKDAQVKNNTCLWKSIGHFAIAVPSPVVVSGSGNGSGGGGGEGGGVVEKKRRSEGLWSVFGVVCGCGVLMGICVIGIIRFVKKNMRMVKMERRGEEDEALSSVWIEGIQIPKAEMTRTKPFLETIESGLP